MWLVLRISPFLNKRPRASVESESGHSTEAQLQHNTFVDSWGDFEPLQVNKGLERRSHKSLDSVSKPYLKKNKQPTNQTIKQGRICGLWRNQDHSWRSVLNSINFQENLNLPACVRHVLNWWADRRKVWECFRAWPWWDLGLRSESVYQNGVKPELGLQKSGLLWQKTKACMWLWELHSYTVSSAGRQRFLACISRCWWPNSSYSSSSEPELLAVFGFEQPDQIMWDRISNWV